METIMNRNVLILTAILAIGATPFSLAYSGQESDRDPGSSVRQAAEPTRTMEQRSLFRECVYAAELGREHLDELANVVRHSRPEAGKVSQHLTEVRGAVTEMLEDHHRFILDLTEEQWNAAQRSITELEQLRAAINTQLEGIDAELRMPVPDSKVLARYTKKTGRRLRQWQEQHRKMGAALGMKDL
jgi:chromosome segregation ATPase